MPKQDWNINTGTGAAGDVYGLAFTNSQRFTYCLDADLKAYGLGVQQGVRSDTVKIGANAGQVLGITMRQNVNESATRPGDGTVLLKAGSAQAVMVEGPIQVKLKTAITDRTIGVSATGEFGKVDATYIECTNVTAMKYPAAAGDVIPVMVYLTPLK
ncbi:MAG: hypothetical protein [Caudoviricetes sp.]|nr:MAG: hypothetical protein [Caudoviricetes sp.]